MPKKIKKTLSIEKKNKTKSYVNCPVDPFCVGCCKNDDIFDIVEFEMVLKTYMRMWIRKNIFKRLHGK